MKTRKKEADNLAYRFRIDDDGSYRLYFAKTDGCCRFVYNRLVDDEGTYYKVMGKKLGNEVSDYKDDYPFLKEVDSLALAGAKMAYGRAMDNFFGKRAAYPKFKSKKAPRLSFTTYMVGRNIKYDEAAHLLTLPKKDTPVKIIQHRKIRHGGTLKSVTLSREADGAYYAFIVTGKQIGRAHV